LLELPKFLKKSGHATLLTRKAISRVSPLRSGALPLRAAFVVFPIFDLLRTADVFYLLRKNSANHTKFSIFYGCIPQNRSCGETGSALNQLANVTAARFAVELFGALIADRRNLSSHHDFIGGI